MCPRLVSTSSRLNGAGAAPSQRPSEFDIILAVNAMKCSPQAFSDFRDDPTIDFLADETHRGKLDRSLLNRLTAKFSASCGRFGVYPSQPVIERMLDFLRDRSQERA